MATQVLMPALSPTMTEGKIAKWLKKEGDPVKSGDIIAEIETDKATMEFEAIDDGKMGQILVPEGTENVAVNQPIAEIIGEDEKPGAAPAKAPPPKADSVSKQEKTEESKPPAQERRRREGPGGAEARGRARRARDRMDRRRRNR